MWLNGADTSAKSYNVTTSGGLIVGTSIAAGSINLETTAAGDITFNGTAGTLSSANSSGLILLTTSAGGIKSSGGNLTVTGNAGFTADLTGGDIDMTGAAGPTSVNVQIIDDINLNGANVLTGTKNIILATSGAASSVTGVGTVSTGGGSATLQAGMTSGNVTSGDIDTSGVGAGGSVVLDGGGTITVPSI